MGLFKTRQDCFCAFCRKPRKMYLKKHASLFNIVGSFLTAGIISWVLFQSFDPKSLILFVVLLAISEIVVQIRWRINIVCRHCGFDPILYKKDPLKAASLVKVQLDKRKLDPISILSEPLKLPVLTKERALVLAQQEAQLYSNSEAKKTRGRLVSKQI
jgi:hypothetical protein